MAGIAYVPGPWAPQAYDKFEAAQIADSVLDYEENQAAVAAFNTGIYDYFMERDVINLDGVVNPHSLEAIREGTLPTYLQMKNIRYVIEHDVGQAAHFELLYEADNVIVSKWVDLTALVESPQYETTKRTYLWRLEVRD
jgi:hypothetical protein